MALLALQRFYWPLGPLEGLLGTLEGLLGPLEGLMGHLEGLMGPLEGILSHLEGILGPLRVPGASKDSSRLL